MSKSQKKIPKYGHHQGSGQAVVYLAGKPVYLGLHGTPASLKKYERVIAEWLASGRQLVPSHRPGPVTLTEAVAIYDRHAAGYYRKNGKPTKQLERVRRSLGVAVQLYGPRAAAEFDSVSLEAVQAAMIRRGWTRTHVNSCIGCIKTAFRWICKRKIVPSSVYADLCTVDALRAGRSGARESAPVKPVPWEHILPVLRRVLPVVGDMIRLQLLTGARPGEVCALRPCDLDTSGSVWIYRVPDSANKNAHRGQSRSIFIGPHAQRLLEKYLKRPVESYCFSPREAVSKRFRQLGWELKPGHAREPGVRYQRGNYQQAIKRACEKAGIPVWTAHALRHSFGTRIREEFGVEIAQTALGHRSLKATEIYAQANMDGVAQVIGKVG